jgi:hypothetical protein
MNAPTQLLLTAQGLSAAADRVTVRDPRGRTVRPGIRPVAGGLLCAGPVLLRHDYVVDKDAAIRFLDATGDDNRIHREENVVPGALTASRVVGLLEVLAPDLEIHEVRVKFTAPSYYGARAVAAIRLDPRPDGTVQAEAETWFHGAVVAKTSLTGRVTPSAARAVPVKERKVNRELLALVDCYFRSIGLDPAGYRAKPEGPDFTYPVSFLTALPPGEMVRRLGGQGGILNALNLSFGESPRLPIVGDRLPEVALEQGKVRRESLFARVLTRIIDGLTTYGRGFALVASAPARDGLRPLPGA